MAKLLKLRRGTTAQHASFTGAEGEVTIDTTKDTAVVHDGSQAGGRPLAREDMSNVSSASIAGQLGTDSIATTKIAAGDLPSDVVVYSANINNNTIVNGDISPSAAIAGTKVAPDFGSQNITTTGSLTVNNNNFKVQGTSPNVFLTDTNNDSDYKLTNNEGQFIIFDVTNTATRLAVNADGHVDVIGNLDVGAGLDVTGAITSTGSATISNTISIEGTSPSLNLTDSNANSDFQVKVDGGHFDIKDVTNNAGRLNIQSDGTTTIAQNLNVGAGLDVTGNITNTGTIVSSGDITINEENPALNFTDVGENPDYQVRVDAGKFFINDTTNSAARLTVETDGHIDIPGRIDATGGIAVTGNITVSGTVDGRDVAADGTKLDGIESGATADQSASEILTAIKTVDGVNSGLDADLLDGMHASDAASNATVVARNASGYIFANYFNTTANDVSSGVTKIMCETGNDNYIRHADAGAVRTFINVENGATGDQTGSEIGTALNGENVGTSGTGVANVYNKGWFRNEDNGDGMYNQSTNQHWYSDSSNYWNMGGGQSAHGIRFRDNHASTVRGYVYATNNNDIGFLNNSGGWSFKCDSSGNVTATGNVTAYSDARLKTNVNTINDALSIVGKLRGVSFDWKESGKRSIGVIAQEVEAVLPELVVTQNVSTTENPEPKEVKSVDYGKIVGVLINAINELKAEVDELKGGK